MYETSRSVQPAFRDPSIVFETIDLKLEQALHKVLPPREWAWNRGRGAYARGKSSLKFSSLSYI